MPWGLLGAADTTILFSHAPHRLAWIFALNGAIVVVFWLLPAFFPNLQKYIPNLNKPSPSEGRELDSEDLMLVMEHRPRRSFLSRMLAKLRH
jgi:hypothetical protein